MATANLNLTLPTPDVSTGWGGTLNTDFQLIDDVFSGAGTGTSVGLNVGSGKIINVGGSIIAGGTVILGSGDTTTTVTAPVIRGAARTGTNASGANLTIDAPNGTGTGGSGNFIFRVAPAGSTGSTANTMQTALEIKNTGAVEVGGVNISTYAPSGMVASYAGSAAPSGWLLCYGQSVSTTTYAALFASIGYTYGGAGANFTIPDLRGRAVAGVDNMGGTTAGRITAAVSGITGTTLGAAGGVEGVTLTIDQMPAHTHTIAASGSGTGATVNTAGGTTTITSNSTGGGTVHTNTQPTFMLNYIIKT